MLAPTLALLTAPRGGAKQLAGKPVRACCLIELR